MKDWIEVGDRVIYRGRPDGERARGIQRNGGTAWLVGGASGIVVEPPKGGHPRHRCPNHESPDCVCDGDGWIDEKPSHAVVAWDMSDGEPHRRCIYAEDEGKEWARRRHSQLEYDVASVMNGPCGPRTAAQIVKLVGSTVASVEGTCAGLASLGILVVVTRAKQRTARYIHRDWSVERSRAYVIEKHGEARARKDWAHLWRTT